MKRTRIAILTCLLALLLATTALAQTTGVNLDGKCYAFIGGPGAYEADGVTFVIGEDSVTVQRPGGADLVRYILELHGAGCGLENSPEGVRFTAQFPN